MDVVTALTEVQMDPTSAVARTEHLVLFSRLGPSFRVADLERLLWRERRLFEYEAHIVPTADLPIHRISMRRYPHGPWKRHEYVRRWLDANDQFVRYALGELRVEEPCVLAILRTGPPRVGEWVAGTTRGRTFPCCSRSSGRRAA